MSQIVKNLSQAAKLASSFKRNLILTAKSLRSAKCAAATIVLGNNLLGLAPAPWVVGRLSDSFGLQTAMAVVPAVSLAAAVCFIVAARHYASDCRTYEALRKDLDGPVTFAVH